MSRETPKAALVHFQTEYPNRAYCGASNSKSAKVRQDVTCPNCLAAIRADEEARS